MRAIAHSLCVLAVLGLATTPAMAEKARHLRYIVGLKSETANRALHKEGFRLEDIEGHRNRFRRTYWWQARDKHCVEVRVRRRNNRVTDIRDARDRDCGQSNGLNKGKAIALGAGVLALGAIVAGNQSRGGSDKNTGHASPPPPSFTGGQIEIADLNGVPANSADTALRERGFVAVDAFTSASSAYTIWWRAASEQCVQMTSVDGAIYDIRDIGQHPNCE